MSTSDVIISPSILSANFVRLEQECQKVLEAGADWLHIDVMDGRFVPNITIGLPVVQSLRSAFPQVTLDVHLMIEEPDRYAARFVDAGADIVSFHPEATYHPHRVIQTIKDAGGKAAVAVNPGSSLQVVDPLLEELSMVLMMSVNPGFGGQKFIPATLERIHHLSRMIKERGLDVRIEVDGGVTAENAADVVSAGATVLVSGTGIFRSSNWADAIRRMKSSPPSS